LTAKRISILGSTGSIGAQALEVVASFPEKIEVIALAAGNNIKKLAEQARRFQPKLISIADPLKIPQLKELLGDFSCQILAGEEGLGAVATHSEAQLVLSSLVGIAGLAPTLKALEAGKDVALANKESLVAGGHLVLEAKARWGGRLLPVDSEHSALFQCLDGREHEVEQLILTASGGPFRNRKAEDLEKITPQDALAHPNWQMGAKVTVDSATMMNKGLEVIEAHWLFGTPYSKIEVLVHPQSIVHSLVKLVDGGMLAQLAVADMRLPIAYALSYPKRWSRVVPQLDLTEQPLTFQRPNPELFPALTLARDAAITGGGAPVVLNGANEVAVAAFLAGKLSYLDICPVVEEALARCGSQKAQSLEAVLALDREAKRLTEEIIEKK
jgi:1-deoxy-D-xylulose-5-phosphate reductoisomerase